MPSSARQRADRARPLHPLPTRRSSDLPGSRPRTSLRRRSHRLPRPRRRCPRCRLRARTRTLAPPRRAASPCGPRPSARPRSRVRRSSRSEEHTSELQSHHDLVCRPQLDSVPTAHDPCTLSLHDALPISLEADHGRHCGGGPTGCRDLDEGARAAAFGPGHVHWRRHDGRHHHAARDRRHDRDRAYEGLPDRKSTRLNSSHITISYAVLSSTACRPRTTPAPSPYTTLFRSPWKQTTDVTAAAVPPAAATSTKVPALPPSGPDTYIGAATTGGITMRPATVGTTAIARTKVFQIGRAHV